MMMGDLVLLEAETEPVIDRLLATGLRVTALHNHLMHESPRVMFLHIDGEGDPVRLARSVMSALALTMPPHPANLEQAAAAVDWRPVEKILGRTGHQARKVLQFSVPRSDSIAMNGREIPPAMGVAHVINLQTVGRNAATTGDFVLLANEVIPVVRALKENGIAVTALHSHMLQESPRVFFLHFWAVGEPERLAHGLRRALDQTSVRD